MEIHEVKMCRLFGFRSSVHCRFDQCLLDAENAFVEQSKKNPHGWGIAYFINKIPHVFKEPNQAYGDGIFTKISQRMKSITMLAHIRAATQGDHNILNTHPFQFGSWVFAHNGNIKNFSQNREEYIDLVSREFKSTIFGDSDSEIIFFILLTYLQRIKNLENPTINANELTSTVRYTIKAITEISGPIHGTHDGPDSETYLTFLMTNGKIFCAFNGGKNIYISTFKKTCSQKQSCPGFLPECEHPPINNIISHAAFSTEPIGTNNHWELIKPNNLAIIDMHEQLTIHNKVAFT